MPNKLSNISDVNNDNTFELPELSKYSLGIEAQKKQYEIFSKWLQSTQVREIQNKLRYEKLTAKEREKLEKTLLQEFNKIQKQSITEASEYEKRVYKELNLDRQREITLANKKIFEEQLKNLELEKAQALADAQEIGISREEIEAQFGKEKLNIQKKIQENTRNEVIEITKGAAVKRAGFKETLKFITTDKQAREAHLKELDELEKELFEKRKEAQKQGNQELVKEYEEQIEALSEEKAKTTLAGIANKTISAITGTYDQAFQKAEDMLTTYKSHIDARLQGSEKTYDSITHLISSNLALSPFVRTTTVMEKLKEAVDKGIAYNVEERAFLATISDKIANTFDAFDSNLVRLIKLQQADTTAARLGMEASLTRFFNTQFNDTGYLTGIYDQVSAALIDAEASMSRDSSAQFEYVVQKWLGSLSSMGMSENTITNIATSLNYLATGNVSALGSNPSMQTLLAMSASKAGLPYAQLLTEGLNAESTNKLLKSMVEYLADIAENSENQVVRSAYGDIFNLSLSDMKALTNLTSNDISAITSSNMTYNNMRSELTRQFIEVGTSRLSLPEAMSNIYNNMIYGVASDIVNNPATYAMSKMLEFMRSETGGAPEGINIPFISAAGFGLDLNTTINNLLGLGIMVGQATSFMVNLFKGLGSLGGINLKAWGGKEYNTSRGSGLAFTTGALFGGTSGSSYVGNVSMQEMQSSTLSSATSSAEETSEITNKNVKADYTIENLHEDIIGEEAKAWVVSKDSVLQLLLNNSGAAYLSTQDTRMRISDGSVQIINPSGVPLSVSLDRIDAKIEIPKQELKISADTELKINQESLVKAVRAALGYNAEEESITLADLIKMIESKELAFSIDNVPGNKLQVDTEWVGTSGYMTPSNINW